MKLRYLVLLFAFAMSGCATSTAGNLPICDGKHRRPGNPHGSVLDATPPADPATPDTTALSQPQPQPECGL